MEEEINITEVIINSINTIFQTIFSSIDNNLYSVLDEITFINTDILNSSYFKNIFGTSSSHGILLIANSLILGFILYYARKTFIITFFYYSSGKTCKFYF